MSKADKRAHPAGAHARMKRMRLDELIAAPYNPRKISGPALAGLSASIARFGLVQPVIVNERTGRVVGGHQRIKAMAAQGETETDAILVDLPESEEKALNVALNSASIARFGLVQPRRRSRGSSCRRTSTGCCSN